jgi:hypothetical protein
MSRQPDELQVRPPGQTCPKIDAAQRTMRRLAWRARNPDRAGDAPRLLSEGPALLEVVREENAQMRAAYYAMRSQLKDG